MHVLRLYICTVGLAVRQLHLYANQVHVRAALRPGIHAAVSITAAAIADRLKISCGTIVPFTAYLERHLALRKNVCSRCELQVHACTIYISYICYISLPITLMTCTCLQLDLAWYSKDDVFRCTLCPLERSMALSMVEVTLVSQVTTLLTEDEGTFKFVGCLANLESHPSYIDSPCLRVSLLSFRVGIGD